MLPPHAPANTRETSSATSAVVWFSNPEPMANSTYDSAAPAVLMSKIGRRPCRSESRPQMGEKMNCIAENDAMMAPMSQPLAP